MPQESALYLQFVDYPDSKVHGANMGPTGVLSAPDGPHVGPVNLAIRGVVPQWVINYHQHNYHKQQMAAASSGKEQQSAISLILGLPDSWNLHNLWMDTYCNYLIRGWINYSRIFHTVGDMNIPHVDGNLKVWLMVIFKSFLSLLMVIYVCWW